MLLRSLEFVMPWKPPAQPHEPVAGGLYSMIFLYSSKLTVPSPSESAKPIISLIVASVAFGSIARIACACEGLERERAGVVVAR